MPFTIHDRDSFFKVAAGNVHEDRVPITIHAKRVDSELDETLAPASPALREMQIFDVFLAATSQPWFVFMDHCYPPFVNWAACAAPS